MLQIIDHGKIREIRLARPPANALNAELVYGLIDSLEEASIGANAIIVSGSPGMFSAGLDVPELIELDRKEFAHLWHGFVLLMKTIACMPVPTVFALTGHAPAGGLVLALFGDYRIMPTGRFKTGLNEVQVGLTVPVPVHQALVRLIGAHMAERILVAGEMMDAERAYSIGLVDELVGSPGESIDRALSWCTSHLALPQLALQQTREMARSDLRGIFEGYSAEDNQSYVDLWFEEATQTTLKGLVASLKKTS